MKRPAAVCGFTVFTCLLFLCGHDLTVALIVLLVFCVIFLLSVLILLLAKKRLAAIYCLFAVSLSGMIACAGYAVKYETDYLSAAAMATRSETQIVGTVYDSLGCEDGQYTYLVQLADSRCGLELRSYTDLYLTPGDRISGTVPAIYAQKTAQKLSDGVYLYAFTMQNLQTDGTHVNLVSFFAGYRLRLKTRILQATGGDAGGLLCGMVLGDTSGLSARAKNSFMRSGINHIFAVSGFHVSAWSMLVFVFLNALGVGRIPNAAISSAAVLLVCAVTGFLPSAMRAAGMLLCVYLSKCLRYDSDMLNSLGTALLVICGLNPFSGGSISLLLSVSATVGIVLYAEYTEPAMAAILRRHVHARFSVYALRAIAATVLLSLSVSAVMLPLMAYYFGRVSPVAPLANLLLVPFAEIAMMTGGISAICHFRIGVKIAAELCRGILWGANHLASWRFSSIGVSFLPAMLALLLTGVFCLILALLLKKKEVAVLFVCAVYLLSVGISLPAETERYYHVRVSVADSDTPAVLVQYRDRSILLAGEKTGNAAVQMLSEQAVYNLDTLLLFDVDMLPEIAANFNPAEQIRHAEMYDVTYHGALRVRGVSGGCLLIGKTHTVAVMFDCGEELRNVSADILIADRLPSDRLVLRGFREVYICGKGVDTENIHYLKEIGELHIVL